MEDSAFKSGDHAEQMFVVNEGCFQYMMDSGKILDMPLCKKAWASEAALWTEWRHRGDLVALEPATVLEIDAHRFSEILRRHLRSWLLASQYGQHFIQLLNKVDGNSLTDLIIIGEEEWVEFIADCDSYTSDKHLAASAARRAAEATRSESKTVEHTL